MIHLCYYNIIFESQNICCRAYTYLYYNILYILLYIYTMFVFIDKNIFYQVSTDLFNNNNNVHLLYINYITYIILFLLIKITCTVHVHIGKTFI